MLPQTNERAVLNRLQSLWLEKLHRKNRRLTPHTPSSLAPLDVAGRSVGDDPFTSCKCIKCNRFRPLQPMGSATAVDPLEAPLLGPRRLSSDQKGFRIESWHAWKGDNFHVPYLKSSLLLSATVLL